MSEKEFRVWDKDLKKMFYSAFSITSYGDVVDAGWKEEVGMIEEGYYSHEMRGGVDCVVMQSTERKDIHYKKIWEGDILKYSIDGDEQSCPYVVRSIARWFEMMYDADSYYRWDDMGEVIGNVYENPDMAV